MAAPFAGYSTYLRQAILNWIRSTAFPADPLDVYLALFTDLPTVTGGTEVDTATGYARQACAFNAPASVDGYQQIVNTADETFTFAAGTPGGIIGWGLFDAAAAGNFLMGGPLDLGAVVVQNDTFTVPLGTLKINQG